MLQDYAYILKGSLKRSKSELILKIPMEIENDFESQYTVDDLLIGHLSVVGVYKGIVTEDFIKKNTVSYFESLDVQQSKSNGKVIPSSTLQDTDDGNDNSPSEDKERVFHFIDIIALILDVQFEKDDEEH